MTEDIEKEIEKLERIYQKELDSWLEFGIASKEHLTDCQKKSREYVFKKLLADRKTKTEIIDSLTNKVKLCQKRIAKSEDDLKKCIGKIAALNFRNAELKAVIKDTENELDELNAKSGKLCHFCETEFYDGKGISHEEDCLILKLRKKLKQKEERVMEDERKGNRISCENKETG